jgi:hypothetical protein
MTESKVDPATRLPTPGFFELTGAQPPASKSSTSRIGRCAVFGNIRNSGAFERVSTRNTRLRNCGAPKSTASRKCGAIA